MCFRYNSNDNNNSKRVFISNTVIRKKSRTTFFEKLKIASRTEANFVKGATDYEQFKIDYILKYHTREEGLWMTIVISGPREIECYKRVRSDKDPVIGVSQNGPAVVSKIVNFIMIQLIRRLWTASRLWRSMSARRVLLCGRSGTLSNKIMLRPTTTFISLRLSGYCYAIR